MSDEHPFVAVEKKRLEDWQLRLADRITAFAGSMAFVWIHVIIFALWIVVLGELLNGDPYPFGMLTMIVSLEAIFLSTFVMIGQNRQGDLARAKADHDIQVQEEELGHNTQMTAEIHQLTNEIYRLSSEIHNHLGLNEPVPAKPAARARRVKRND